MMTESSPEPSEIANWINAAKAGNDSALGKLVDKFRPLMRDHAQKSIGPHLQARIDDSDVVQQTCLAIRNDIEQFLGHSEPEFIAWMLRILERCVLRNVEREKGAAKRTVDREVADSAPIDNSPGRITTPSQRAIRSEQRKILEDAIAQLPPDQRAAVRLKFLEQATLSETADKLGKSEDAVSGLLQRGVSKLSKILKHYGDAE